MPTVRPSWAQIALCGVVSVVISWVFSACRFGNHVDTPPPPEPTPTPTPRPGITGFYETSFNSLTFLADPSSQTAQSSTADKIPSFVGAAISSPVAFILTGNGGEGNLVNAMEKNPDGSRTSLPMNADASGTLSYNVKEKYTSTKIPLLSTPLWTQDDSCLVSTLFMGSGKLNIADTYNNDHPSKWPVSGRVDLTFQVYVFFDPFSPTATCAPAMELLAACYVDNAKCDTDDPGLALERQKFAISLFKPYIDAGALHASDISNVTTLAYEVTYK